MKPNARFNNSEKISGYVYSTGSNFNQLSERVSGENSKNPGTKYIAGDLDVAVDEAGLNVIPVHYTFVSPTTKAGGSNNTFTALKPLIEGGKTWVKDGKDAAPMVKLEPSFALNDFYINEIFSYFGDLIWARMKNKL